MDRKINTQIKALRLSSLIQDKADREGRNRREVKAELAARLGIQPEAVHKISSIRRGSYIRPEQLIVMSDFFGVSIDQLINPGFVEALKR